MRAAFAQRANRRISIQREERVSDGAGGFTRAWIELSRRWVAGAPSGGTQAAVSDVMQDRESWKFDMRPLDIASGDRIEILNGRDIGKLLRVRSVADTTGRNARLVVLADLEIPGDG